MGIEIDVKANAEAAKRDLAEINRQLTQLVVNTNNLKNFGNFSTDNLRIATKSIDRNTIAFKGMGVESEKALNNAKQSGSSLNRTLSSLRTTIVSVGAAWVGVKSVLNLGRLADDVIDVNNQLRLMTSNKREIDRLRWGLFRLSQDTTTPLRSATSNFVDFYNAVGMYRNVDTSEIKKVVTTVNQALVLGGGTQESWSRVQEQIMNAMSQGGFTNVELRSMMRQGRWLSNMIMKDLDMNAGELRKFTEDGRLTTEAFISSIHRISGETQRVWDSTDWTVRESGGRALESIKYFMSAMLNELNIVPILSRRLLAVGDIFSDLAREVPVAFAFFLHRVKSNFSGLRESISNILTGNIVSKFILDFDLDISGALSFLIDLRDKVKYTVSELIGFISGLFDKVTKTLNSIFDKVSSSLPSGARKVSYDVISGFIESFSLSGDLIDTIKDKLSSLRMLFKEVFTESSQPFIMKTTFNPIEDQLNSFSESFHKFKDFMDEYRFVIVTVLGRILALYAIWVAKSRKLFFSGIAVSVAGYFAQRNKIRSEWRMPESSIQRMNMEEDSSPSPYIKTSGLVPELSEMIPERGSLEWWVEGLRLALEAAKHSLLAMGANIQTTLEAITASFKRMIDRISSGASSLATESLSGLKSFILFINKSIGRFIILLSELNKLDVLKVLAISLGGVYILFKVKFFDRIIKGFTITRAVFAGLLLSIVGLFKWFQSLPTEASDKSGFKGFFENIGRNISRGINFISEKMRGVMDFINESVLDSTRKNMALGLDSMASAVKSWVLAIAQLFVGALLLIFGGFRLKLVGASAVLMFLDNIFDTSKIIESFNKSITALTGGGSGGVGKLTAFAANLAASFVSSFGGNLLKGILGVLLLLRGGMFTNFLGGFLFLDIWKNLFAGDSVRRGLRGPINKMFGDVLSISETEIKSTMRSIGGDLLNVLPSSEMFSPFGLFYDEGLEREKQNRAIRDFAKRWNVGTYIKNPWEGISDNPFENSNALIEFNPDNFRKIAEMGTEDFNKVVRSMSVDFIKSDIEDVVSLKIKELENVEDNIRNSVFFSDQDDALKAAFETWKVRNNITEDLTRTSERLRAALEEAVNRPVEIKGDSPSRRFVDSILKGGKEYGATIAESLGILLELIPAGVAKVWDLMVDKIADSMADSGNIILESLSGVMDNLKGLRSAFNFVTLGMGDMITTSLIVGSVLAALSGRIRSLIKFLVTSKFAFQIFGGAARGLWNQGFLAASILGLGLMAGTSESISMWQAMLFSGLLAVFTTSWGMQLGLGIYRTLVQALSWGFSMVGSAMGRLSSRLTKAIADPVTAAYKATQASQIARANSLLSKKQLTTPRITRLLPGLQSQGVGFNSARNQFEKIPHSMREALAQSFSKVKSGLNLKTWLLGTPAEKSAMISSVRRDVATTFRNLRLGKAIPRSPSIDLLKHMGITKISRKKYHRELLKMKRALYSLDFKTAFSRLSGATGIWMSNFGIASGAILKDIKSVAAGAKSLENAKALKAGFYTALVGPAKMFAGAIMFAATAVGGLLAVLWPILAIGALFSLPGILFGADGTGEDRISHTIDKLKNMLGITKEFTSAGGRRVELMSTLTIGAFSDFENGSEMRDSISSIIQEMDAGLISEGQFKRTKGYLEELVEIAKQAGDESEEFGGKIFDKTSKELEDKYSRIVRYIGRFARVENQTTITENLRRDMAALTPGISVTFVPKIEQTYRPFFDKPHEIKDEPGIMDGVGEKVLEGTKSVGGRVANAVSPKFWADRIYDIRMGAKDAILSGRDLMRESEIGIARSFGRALSDFSNLPELTRSWTDEALDVIQRWSRQRDYFDSTLPQEMQHLNETADRNLRDFRNLVSNLRRLQGDEGGEWDVARNALNQILSDLDLGSHTDEALKEDWIPLLMEAEDAILRNIRKADEDFFEGTFREANERYKKINDLKFELTNFARNMSDAYKWDIDIKTGRGLATDQPDREFLMELKKDRSSIIREMDNVLVTPEGQADALQRLFQNVFTAETLKNWIEGSSTIKGASEKVSEAFDGLLDSNELFRARLNNEGLVDLTKELGRLKALLESGKGTPEIANRISKINEEMLEMAGLTPFFEEFNKRISKTSLPQINATQSLFGGVSEGMQLASARLAHLQNQRILLMKDGEVEPGDSQRNQRDILDEELNYIKKSSEANVNAIRNMSEVARQSYGSMRVAELFLGNSISDKIKASKELRTQYLGLWQGIAVAEMTLLTAILSDEAKIALAKNIEDMRKMLENMDSGGSVEHPFSVMLSNLAEAGLPVVEEGFAMLSATARSRLREISVELNKIRDNFSDNEATDSFVNSTIIPEIKRRTKLLEEARLLLIDSIHATGELVGDALSRLDLADTFAVARASSDTLKELLSIDREIEALKLTMGSISGSDLEGRVNLSKKLLELEHKRNKITRPLKSTVSSQISEINEAFGTGLEEMSFSRLGPAFIQMLSELSDAMNDFKEADEKKDMPGLAASLSRLNSLRRQGAYVSFLDNFVKDLTDSVYEGVITGYNKVKDLFGSDGLSRSQFMRMDPDSRRSLRSRVSARESLDSILELPNLTQGMVDNLAGLINEKGISAGIEDFVSGMELRFEDPIIKLTNAVDRNTSALLGETIDNAKNERKEAIERGAGNVSFVGLSDVLEKSAIEELGASFREQMNNRSSNTTVSIAGLAGYTLDPRINNLMDPRRDRFEDVSMSLGYASTSLEDTSIIGEERAFLQRAVDRYTSELDRITSHIDWASNIVREYGEEFSQAIEDSIRNALQGLFKGEKDEGKGYLETFFYRMMDDITSAMVDAFVEGLLYNITGPEGKLTQMSRDLGEGIIGAFIGRKKKGEEEEEGSGANLLGGLPSVEEEGGGFFQTLLNPIKDAFASVFSDGGLLETIGGGLSDIFHAVFSGDFLKSAFSIFKSILSFIPGFSTGGTVMGPAGHDVIPAMLTKDEFVVRASRARMFAPLLHQINYGALNGFNDGGFVGSTPVFNSAELPAVEGHGEVTQNFYITGDVSRQTRSEMMKMMPLIANGVNSVNKERGYKG